MEPSMDVAMTTQLAGTDVNGNISKTLTIIGDATELADGLMEQIKGRSDPHVLVGSGMSGSVPDKDHTNASIVKLPLRVDLKRDDFIHSILKSRLHRTGEHYIRFQEEQRVLIDETKLQDEQISRLLK